jgi:NAD(P)-dependent dehydrogenase (short-subunit alcohol dehydrogenase family)
VIAGGIKMYTILITGTNRGIGFELTKQYLQDDFRVLACCRLSGTTEELHSLNDQYPETLTIIDLDVTDTNYIEKLSEQLQHEAIDILINNAGIIDSEHTHLDHIESEAFLDTFKTNSLAPLLLAKGLLPSIARSQLKLIANISSSMGSISENTSGGYYAYRASKAALNAITKSLSIDLVDHGVTVLSLHPGWVQTAMGGAEAPITPAESVKGLRQILQKVTLADSGSFIAYDGRMISW